MSGHTKGPWRWELNLKHRGLSLVGGEVKYDLTIIQPTRWGMGSATLLIRDTSIAGMNELFKLHERSDWIKAFPNREHHKDWCADVDHPDMRLIASAPDLLEALEAIEHALKMGFPASEILDENSPIRDGIRAAIAKAKGEA